MTNDKSVIVNGEQIDYYFNEYLPFHMISSMKRYIEEKIQPDSFLMCILSNDLMGATSHADDININYLNRYCIWLHNYAPSACHGSPEKVKEWLNKQ